MDCGTFNLRPKSLHSLSGRELKADIKFERVRLGSAGEKTICIHITLDTFPQVIASSKRELASKASATVIEFAQNSIEYS